MRNAPTEISDHDIQMFLLPDDLKNSTVMPHPTPAQKYCRKKQRKIYLARPVQMAHPLAIAVDPSDAIGLVGHKVFVARMRHCQLVARRNIGYEGLSKGAQ